MFFDQSFIKLDLSASITESSLTGMTDGSIMAIGQAAVGLPDLKAFNNARSCTSGADALQQLEEDPATVVIIAAETEDLTGLEIADAIRDIDDEANHYTYIVLVGEVFDTDVSEAHQSNVDCFVSPDDSYRLKAIIGAGQRLAEQVNQLRAMNAQLARTNMELQKGQLLDALTGLGNRRLAEQSLKDAIRQIESRGGAVCFVMISISNFQEIIDEYDENIAGDLVKSVAEKIQHMVRPMDIVTYLEDGQFALVLVQPTIEHCTADCYRRIYDGVRLKSYKTAVGFLPAKIAMSLCASHAQNGPPNDEIMIATAQKNLTLASQQDDIYVEHLSENI